MAYLGVLFAFIFSLYTTRFIYRNYDWEWYSLALFFLACLLVTSELLIRLPRTMRKGGPGFFSFKRTVAAAVVAVAGLCHIYLADYWLWIAGSGAILIAIAWITPLKKEGQIMVLNKGELMIPDEWDEQAITRSLQSSGANKGALEHYIDNLKVRFVLGQSNETAQKRLAFLKTLNQVYEEKRKEYGWVHAIKSGRILDEENTKDIEARHANRNADLRGQVETAKLERQLRRAQNPESTLASKEKKEEQKQFEAQSFRDQLAAKYNAQEAFRKINEQSALTREKNRLTEAIMDDANLTTPQKRQLIDNLNADYNKAMRRVSGKGHDDIYEDD